MKRHNANSELCLGTNVSLHDAVVMCRPETWVTGVRGQRLHLARVVGIDGGHLAVTKEDRPHLGLAGGSDRDDFADQAAANEVAPSLPADGAVDRDGAHHIIRAVGHGGTVSGKGRGLGW